MDKRTAILFAALAAAFIAVVVRPRPQAGSATAPSASAEAAKDAGPADAGIDAASSSGGTTGRADGGAVAAQGPGGEEPGGDLGFPASDAGATLISGAQAPALPATAPKSVVFGVILVTYQGAQGAPPHARPREAALDLAKQIAADAKTDFKAALAKGDKGSMENAGRMPRGMLEPAPEYVLFSLPKDGVSDPVDTPRGFWIVHRIE